MNHLKPSEILETTVENGIAKSGSSFKKLFILGIMAGAYIAFAGAAANMASFNLLLSSETFGLGKILSGTDIHRRDHNGHSGRSRAVYGK